MKTITTLPNTHVIINRLQPADAPDGELSVELLSTTPGFTRQSLSLPRMLARKDQRRPHVSCQGLGDMLDESMYSAPKVHLGFLSAASGHFATLGYVASSALDSAATFRRQVNVDSWTFSSAEIFILSEPIHALMDIWLFYCLRFGLVYSLCRASWTDGVLSLCTSIERACRAITWASAGNTNAKQDIDKGCGFIRT